MCKTIWACKLFISVLNKQRTVNNNEKNTPNYISSTGICGFCTYLCHYLLWYRVRYCVTSYAIQQREDFNEFLQEAFMK
ncbi:hypothetical protein B0I21_11366 [Sphingobacterium paludis]|uniref:Uncharacterized protein n=1 Tax=Sphingobacterium paludis TaxID=1476465 RepID=A0A4R7CT28_9SPHI|nr:hypothetical protein B0I21_11366 [Sphingobacterium paludis]